METEVASAGSSAAANAAGSAAVGGLLGFLNYNTAKRMQEFSQEQQYKYLREAPGHQVTGYRNAGINPMLAYAKGAPSIGNSFPAQPSNMWGSGLRDASDWQSSAYGVSRTNREVRKLEQEIKSEYFRTSINHNESLKGNYSVIQLMGELDAAMKVTGEKGPDAISALAQPRVRAGLQELRAAFASAKNDAEVYEALNSKAVNFALEILGKVSGSGSAIAGAVDRYRARSQRGDIINLNKD